MTILTPFVDVQFGDHDAMRNFLLVHKLSHTQIVTYFQNHGLASLEALPEDVGLDHDPPSWLQVHDYIHHQIGAALNQQGVPDLQTVNLQNEDEFYDWMQVHGELHDAINAITGLS